MRPTVTMTVFGCFAEMTTPTFVLPWSAAIRSRPRPSVSWSVRPSSRLRLRTVTCLRALTGRRCGLPCAVSERTRLTAADETRGSAVAVVAFGARARPPPRRGSGLTLRFLHGPPPSRAQPSLSWPSLRTVAFVAGFFVVVFSAISSLPSDAR